MTRGLERHELTGKLAVLFELQGGMCCLCGEPMDRQITREHVVPKANGGNGQRNVLLSHAHCNQAKGHNQPRKDLIAYCAEIYRQMPPQFPFQDWPLGQPKVEAAYIAPLPCATCGAKIVRSGSVWKHRGGDTQCHNFLRTLTSQEDVVFWNTSQEWKTRQKSSNGS